MGECHHKFLSGVKAFVFFALAVSALGLTYQYGRSVNQSYYRSFSVTGEGVENAAPDTASFMVSVVTDGGSNVSDVQKQNTDKSNAVVEYLKNQGVESKDIKTENYTVTPRYDYPVCGIGKACAPAKIVRYSVMQSLAVKVRVLDTVGELLAGVVASGANSVSDISFVVDDKEKLKEEARMEAIEKAKKQALLLSRAARFSLGKLVSVYEESDSINGTAMSVAEFGGRDVLSTKATEAFTLPSPALQSGTQEQKVRMTLTYEIR
jgi:uncharacterized protein YggE